MCFGFNLFVCGFGVGLGICVSDVWVCVIQDFDLILLIFQICLDCGFGLLPRASWIRANW